MLLRSIVTPCRWAKLSANRSNYTTGFASRPLEPNVRWSIDFKGPLPLTARNNRYLCGIADHFSSKRMMWATPNARGEDAVQALKVFLLSGVGPDVLVPDNALAFIKSKVFGDFCKRLDIELEPPPRPTPQKAIRLSSPSGKCGLMRLKPAT